ncbi:MAG: hypothetical protein IIA33_10610 [Planctomycetes bacterium]|nr:hypothetical protein [Planctomycetota bacterium]
MAEQPSQAADQALRASKWLPTGMLPCFRCGYDLRGSAPQGPCPDCGQPYRRESQYVDVVRQKLRLIQDDALFALLGSVFFDFLAVPFVVLALSSNSPAWLVFAPLLAFFYLLLLCLYGSCWIRLLRTGNRHRRISWGEIRGVGLSRLLYGAGAALAAPLGFVVLL